MQLAGEHSLNVIEDCCESYRGIMRKEMLVVLGMLQYLAFTQTDTGEVGMLLTNSEGKPWIDDLIFSDRDYYVADSLKNGVKTSLDPEDLGYSSLGYSIVPTVQILVSTLINDGTTTAFAETNLLVRTDQDTIFSIVLADSINVLTLRSDYDSLDFHFTLQDSLTETLIVSQEELMTYRTTPLTIVFNLDTGYSIELKPGPEEGKDALLSLLNTDKNYGNSEDIHLYGWTVSGQFVTHHILIDFDLSSLPEGSNIDRALISLYYNPSSFYQMSYHPHNSGDNSFTVSKITESWDEMSVTWNNAPSASEVNQVHVENRPGNTVNYDNIDITDLIKDKYANPTDHHGFLSDILMKPTTKWLSLLRVITLMNQ